MAEGSRPRVALIMTGGGARAAYQVGVLQAISELMPPDVRTPFQIICGTSAGAINAATIAGNASDFRRGVELLGAVWSNFRAHQVYRADPWGVFSNTARWSLALLTGGASPLRRPVSLLDNTPLAGLLAQNFVTSGIQYAIDCGDLIAFSVTCSGYTSGESVTFFQGRPELQPWERARRIGVAMPITIDHLLASSAMPFIFPPVRINREYFGDGSMRQIAPVSPALHLGANRLLVIGVGRQLQQKAERTKVDNHPSLAQIAGHALNSIFLDSLEVDLERLQRINRTLEMIPRELLAHSNYPLHSVDFRVITPSAELEGIATAYSGELPRTIRLLLHAVGAMRRSGANLLTYVLFERSYCRALIQLGYKDAMDRKDDLAAFLGWPRSS